MSQGGSGSPDDKATEKGHYQLLLDITDTVARAKNLTAAFHEFARPVLSLTGCNLLNLSLHDPYRDCMLTRYWKRNQESGQFDAFPVDGAVTGWAWKHQEAIEIPDTAREQRFPGCVSILLTHGVRSYTALPLSTPSAHFGAVGLGNSLPDEILKDEDIKLLSSVASMGVSLELEKLLPIILATLRSSSRYERSLLSLFEEGRKTVRLAGDASEWGPYVPNGDPIPLQQALSERAIRTRSPAFFNASELRTMNSPLARGMFSKGIQSVLSVPLIAGNQAWGALHVSSMDENAFAQPDVEYLQQVANQIAAAVRNAHVYREIETLKDRLLQEKRYLESEIRTVENSDDIIGSSPALKRVLDYAAIVADTDATVLITGETGTGKERIARMIHTMSKRKDRNFIKMNCAAIPTGLLESELFGHEKGAFTGAVSQKVGRLELADKGTLLLDEIGEIPLEVQPKLLRVLQDREFERLGGTKTIKVDVRLIAATNRDLPRAVEEKEFRSDLFYRLHVFPLHLPALRDRREDIPMLVRHFVEKCSIKLHKHIDIIPKEAVEAMSRWRWPGNIRELENFVERSVILSEGRCLNTPLTELKEEISRQSSESDVTLRDREREHIVEILRQTRGALSGPTGAAARLGLKRTTLQYKMQKLGISRADFLN